MRVSEHAVVIAGGGPAGMMLAAELALAGVDVAVVERRTSQDLPGARAGGLHSRTIEVLDQRGIADRFLSQGRWPRSRASAGADWTSVTFPPGIPTGSGCGRTTSSAYWAGWVGELAVPIHRGREVTGFAQDDTGSTSSCPTGSGCGRTTSSDATEDAVWSVRKPASSSRVGSDDQRPDRRGREWPRSRSWAHAGTPAVSIPLQVGIRDSRWRSGLHG